MATHSSIAAWEFPWTEEPAKGVRHDLATKQKQNRPLESEIGEKLDWQIDGDDVVTLLKSTQSDSTGVGRDIGQFGGPHGSRLLWALYTGQMGHRRND